MMDAQHATPPVEKAAEFDVREVAKKEEHCRDNNKMESEVHLGTELYIAWPSNREISVKLSCDEQQGLNEALILLPVEEVQRFTQALIEHPLLLPTSYSQNSSVKGEKHSLRLVSAEPFADFAQRLSDALGVLGKE